MFLNIHVVFLSVLCGFNTGDLLKITERFYQFCLNYLGDLHEFTIDSINICYTSIHILIGNTEQCNSYLFLCMNMKPVFQDSLMTAANVI